MEGKEKSLINLPYEVRMCVILLSNQMAKLYCLALTSPPGDCPLLAT